MWDPSSQPGTEPEPPAVEHSLNCLTAREIPLIRKSSSKCHKLVAIIFKAGSEFKLYLSDASLFLLVK